MKYFLIRTLVCTSFLAAPFLGTASEETFQKGSYSFTGTLYPKHTTKISSQVQGKILEMKVDVGDYVKKDQVVAIIDPLFFEIDVQKMKNLADLANVSYEESELEYNRMKKLWDKQDGETPSISKKQFEQACTNWKQKKLVYEQALIDLERSQKLLEETKIKAPYDGVITERFVDPGEAIIVVPVTPVFEIMDVTSLLLEFSLPQDFLPFVRIGQEVIFDKNCVGSIEKIFPHVDVSSRCFKCRVLIENLHGNLKPGLFVKGVLPIKKSLPLAIEAGHK